jgi:hypothetical protein
LINRVRLNSPKKIRPPKSRHDGKQAVGTATIKPQTRAAQCPHKLERQVRVQSVRECTYGSKNMIFVFAVKLRITYECLVCILENFIFRFHKHECSDELGDFSLEKANFENQTLFCHAILPIQSGLFAFRAFK